MSTLLHTTHFNAARGKVEASGFAEHVAERMGRLAEMSQRREQLRQAGDRKGLLALAEEYAHFGTYGMKGTADSIRREVSAQLNRAR